jgi:ATP/maltotriose-dependent transcriptional regulator MalT
MHSAVADVFIDAVPSVSNPIAAAYHLASAGRWAEAAPRYLAAGDSARGRFATHSALDSYERALDALFHYPDTASNALELNIRERLADVHIVLNHQERALEQLQRVRELARTSGDAEAEGRALTALSYVQTRLYRTGDALQTGREALDVAHVAEDVEILASAYANLAHVHLVVGELEESSVYLHEATRAAGKTANVQGEASMFRGDYPQAAHLAQEALKLAEASGDSLRVGGALWVQGWALGELGRYRQAKEALESGLRRLRESGESHYLGRLLNTLGWLHSEFGDLESALAWDLQALETATGGKGGPLAEVERYSLLNLATDELLLGNIEEAEAYLTRVGKLMNEVEYSRFRYLNRYHLVKAELALVKRDAAETLRSVAEAYDLATAKGARKNICKSLLLRGRALLALGQTPEAIVSIQQAKAVADELLHGSLRWQCTLTLAQAYRLAGHVDEAASLIEAGASLLDQAVAALPAGHSREAFLQSPTARALLAGSRDGEEQRVHPHSPDDLTERQVEVLQYVARGKTNREIAEILVLSERTVQRHVLDIYRKLGVHNRAQATAYVLDGPLRRK